MRSDRVRTQEARHRGKRPSGAIGIAMIAVGLIIIIAVGSYYGYRAYAHSKLDQLNVALDGPATLPSGAALDGFVPVESAGSPDAGDDVARDTALASPDDAGQAGSDSPVGLSAGSAHVADPTGGATDRTDGSREGSAGSPSLVSLYGSIYPGAQMHPKYWTQPLWAGSDILVPRSPGPPDGYRVPMTSDLVLARGQRPTAQRILVPLIGVDSAVDELQILDLGDSRSYETPDNVVGHIPETSNPGESGAGWFFGHLESPIRGEGNVFTHLPRIPELLKDGDPVYVTIESEDGTFLYQVTETTQVHEDDLRLFDTERSTIILVACVPRLVYDHRLLVTARLVGVKS